METQSDGEGSAIATIRNRSQQLEARMESQRTTQLELLSYLQTQVVPAIVPTIDLSLKVLSAFNGRPFTPTPSLPDPKPNPNKPIEPIEPTRPLTPEPQRSRLPSPEPKPTNPITESPKLSPNRANPEPTDQPEPEDFSPMDEMGNPLSVVRAMVAVCLLERVPFSRVDSLAILRKLEGDQNATSEEKAALRELGGESGAILAVEMALRSMAEENGGVELEEFVVSGKSRVMVLGIDRTRLMKELPESKQFQSQDSNLGDGNGNLNQNQSQQQVVTNGVDGNGGGVFGMGGPGSRPMQDMWMGPNDTHMAGLPPMFPGNGPPGSLMGPRGAPSPRVMGMMGMPRGMSGVPPMHRAGSLGPNATMDSPNSMSHKPRSEEEEMKDLEALLNKKTFKELQKSKTGEELLDLIHRPTAKETAVAAKFKTKGGSQLKEYCTSLTKEDCRRQSNSVLACEKVHFRRIIAPHTDVNLGDCSFLDTCRHMKTCKYVHYELDPTPDVSHMMMGAPALNPHKPLKPQRAEYCSEVELGQPQWINCDIRNFRMDILGQFGVIMADPPWDIHMELPYGTMADDEMRNLNVPALQTDGLIFLWVTGRAMELGRECLELWGYKRIEELIWVKTNQLQRIIRTGRTGHWLNHSKEHCLVGIKGEPLVNRNIDTDVIVAEVRETSRKPDEMYPLLERISPRTRKLELFARMHNTHAGWMSLGNQLSGVRLVDEGLRARFKAAYPDVEVQPASPPRPSAMEVDSNAAQMRNPFSVTEPKSTATQFAEPAVPDAPFAASEVKPTPVNIDMERSCDLSQLPNLVPKLVNLPQAEARPMDVDTNDQKFSIGSCRKSVNETSNSSALEFGRFTENNEFRLRAEQNTENTVFFLTLRNADTCGRVRNIHFEFYLDSDTAMSIAGEMVEQLDLSHEDVPVIAELIDKLIMKLVPGWKPSSESSSCGANSSCGDHPAHQNILSPLAYAEDQDNQASMISDTSACSAEYGVPTASCAGNVKVSETAKYSSDECCTGSDGYGSSPDCMVQGGLKEKSYEAGSGDSVVMNDACPDMSSICSLSELSLVGKDRYDELKGELDAIDVQYHQCLLELLRMREEEIQNAKKRWIEKKKIVGN